MDHTFCQLNHNNGIKRLTIDLCQGDRECDVVETNVKLTNSEFVFVHFSYELANGQFFAEKGYLKEDGSQVKEGGYSYTDTNGNTQSTSYTADDSGFHPIVGKKSFILLQFHFI